MSVYLSGSSICKERLAQSDRPAPLMAPTRGSAFIRSPDMRFDACPRPDNRPILRLVGPWRSLVSASVWGAEGREFEFHRPDHHRTAHPAAGWAFAYQEACR